MLAYMLDTNICIYVMKTYPLELRDKFNALAEQLCISSITLGELHYGAERRRRVKPVRSSISRRALRCWRSGARPPRITASCGRNWNARERPVVRTTCRSAGHARSEGLIVVTNDMREFARMPGVRAENWSEGRRAFSFI